MHPKTRSGSQNVELTYVDFWGKLFYEEENPKILKFGDLGSSPLTEWDICENFIWIAIWNSRESHGIVFCWNRPISLIYVASLPWPIIPLTVCWLTVCASLEKFPIVRPSLTVLWTKLPSDIVCYCMITRARQESKTVEFQWKIEF